MQQLMNATKSTTPSIKKVILLFN